PAGGCAVVHTSSQAAPPFVLRHSRVESATHSVLASWTARNRSAAPAVPSTRGFQVVPPSAVARMVLASPTTNPVAAFRNPTAFRSAVVPLGRGSHSALG